MIHRVLLTIGVVTCAAVPAAGQVLGLPVINNGVVTGIKVSADVGFSSAEYFSGGGTAIGARVSVGVGFVGVSAAVSRFTPKNGDAVFAPGASATWRLIGGPLVPFRITLQGGASRWTIAGTDYVHVPLSIGLSATIPNPAFAIKPWIAPRIDILGDQVNTKAHFGISGGIDLAFLSGISVRAAYDRVSPGGSHQSIFSLGLGFAP